MAGIVATNNRFFSKLRDTKNLGCFNGVISVQVVGCGDSMGGGSVDTGNAKHRLLITHDMGNHTRTIGRVGDRQVQGIPGYKIDAGDAV